MKFPYSMLLDFVQTELSAEQVGDLLTMAGFELEGIEEVEGDAVLDIKVVSNRGDGLSVFGLSREVLAKDLDSHPTDLYRAAAQRFEGESLTAAFEIPAETATIEAPECNRFSVRAFRGIPTGLQAPEWMQKRLRQAGMRPISLLVDLTNYVMLELGQPLHSFDRDLLSEGRLVVRHARSGEKLRTLNGEDHELNGQMMICDAEKPVGVPGVMGGEATEIHDGSVNVLLESANFRNTTVRKTRKQLGLSTEASYRFERSVDPDGTVAGIRRFSQLLAESLPGVEVSNIVDLYPNVPQIAPVRLRTDRASRLLGMEITVDQAESYLTRLGMEVVREGEQLTVTPPTWRPDIVREEDLVEELGRVHGYDKIPEAAPTGSTSGGGVRGDYLRTERLRRAALMSGYTEIVSHSLRAFHPLDRSTDNRVGPRVPASPEHAILRDSLLPSLAETAQRNGGRDLHLFEVGHVFAAGAPCDERTFLSLLSTGALVDFNRVSRTSPTADFFSLKGAIEEVLASAGAKIRLEPLTGDERFHPTRCAVIRVGEIAVGWLGQIHPTAAKACRLSPETYLAEVDVTTLLSTTSSDPELRSISRNPAVRRDVTVAVDKSVAYEKLAEAIRSASGEVLETLTLVDIYTGTGLSDGQHALTFGMQFRKANANFTDEEANQVRDAAVAALTNLGATMR